MRKAVGLRAAGVTAAVAAVLAAGGCGTSGAGAAGAAGVSSPSLSPSPSATADSGPFTKERARAELEAAAADAGAPAPDPDWASMSKEAPAGSLGACTVNYKGFGTQGERVEVGTYEAVLAKLRERGWQETGQRNERKAQDGTVGLVQNGLRKRGWKLVAEFRAFPEEGSVSLVAFEDACTRRVRKG
ncbi:hypothetical protein ACFU3J_05050 [Streptomyces sp. NPDC057411]|uniref:hypothetical protein n=1 Tax=unclassified Streptomyces TaxID=2593676 RepID=UPI00363FE348